ncbi:MULTISPECIES: hypothetical protein [Planktothrix]|nr:MULTISPECIES: hypothetical protein [Planktothrix]
MRSHFGEDKSAIALRKIKGDRTLGRNGRSLSISPSSRNIKGSLA